MQGSPKKVIGITLLLMLVLAGISAFLSTRRGGDIQRQVAETRRALRDQGFKTDLTDFNLTTDSASRIREAALTSFGGTVRPASSADSVDLMPQVTDDTVVVVAKQDWLKSESGGFDWPELHDQLEADRPQLDAACDAALSGPIQFNLDASRGPGMLLRHLAPLRRLNLSFASRTVAELHDNHRDAAWTNLLAETRLVTAWKTEPVEISYFVRFSMEYLAFNATWQALQDGNWPDDKLATLQHEWETTDFFSGLPETAAFRRASAVYLCRQMRQQPVTGGPGTPNLLKLLVDSPRSAGTEIKRTLDEARYRSYGTYADEKNLLLFYQKHEVELRASITATNWLQMRALPGMTNEETYTSPYPSRMQVMMNAHSVGLRSVMTAGLPVRAAAAEARRRVLITGIALERYRGRHGVYPQTLAALAPEFLTAVPVDFIDGQPLRYHLTDDGHFILYSIGTDGVDDGGKMPVASAPSGRGSGGGYLGGLVGTASTLDIVWPRPASETEAASVHQAQVTAVNTAADDDAEREAVWLWQHSDKRQASVEKLLGSPPPVNTPEINVGGLPLSQVLRNPSSAGTNVLSLTEMLTLKQVITGDEPETVTFEVPVAYDIVTNLGTFSLMLDPDYRTDDEEGNGPQIDECNRATNGNCLLVWHTIYESPGKHALQAVLFLNGKEQGKPDASGPFLPFIVTNLCQFSTASSTYDVDHGALFRGRLPEANCTYTIECLTTNGEHLKSLGGSTTNGEFKVVWNLVDDHGNRLGGETFNSTIQLTFPDSGRTQTMRGP